MPSNSKSYIQGGVQSAYVILEHPHPVPPSPWTRDSYQGPANFPRRPSSFRSLPLGEAYSS